MVPLLLKNWRINGKRGEKNQIRSEKKGEEGDDKEDSYIFARRKRKNIEREPLKRDPCYWATRHTALWPTDRLYSHTILPPASSRRYLSRSLPFFLSLQRLRPSATGLSVPFQHADLPSARYEARVSSSEFNRRDTAIQWIPFPRCPSGWSNALNYSLALPHVLHNRRKILIDPFFLLKSYQCIYIYIYLNRIIFCHSFEWNIYHCYNNRNILNQIVSFFFNFDIEIFKPCHDLKKKLRNIR